MKGYPYKTTLGAVIILQIIIFACAAIAVLLIGSKNINPVTAVIFLAVMTVIEIPVLFLIKSVLKTIETNKKLKTWTLEKGKIIRIDENAAAYATIYRLEVSLKNKETVYSNYFNFDPHEFLEDKTIDVYVNPQNDKETFVDTRAVFERAGRESYIA
ncbi:hypothetical protein Emin_0040 [Elusimicrobium minutum Pei191]|uniref:Uncharacterized protein n=1 Tax=Elusimicrobium minutum (strain Pei191) TaxID=445932 RepID=B2KAR2_ELUMP|nr:hypothetical protein [Elusimicrobium minutum]ACC97608.1 hypothetical protein Emin_0040 [Elusimicrobium minutum Pei191]